MPNSLTTILTSQIDTGSNIQQIGSTYKDPKTGNEYIYLPGAASVVANDVCSFVHTTAGAYTLSRVTTSTRGRVVVALAAVNATTSAGWFLLNGAGTVNSSGATSGGALYASATAGQVTSTSAANAGIVGAHSTSATSSGTSGIFLKNAYFSAI